MSNDALIGAPCRHCGMPPGNCRCRYEGSYELLPPGIKEVLEAMTPPDDPLSEEQRERVEMNRLAWGDQPSGIVKGLADVIDDLARKLVEEREANRQHVDYIATIQHERDVERARARVGAFEEAAQLVLRSTSGKIPPTLIYQFQVAKAAEIRALAAKGGGS